MKVKASWCDLKFSDRHLVLAIDLGEGSRHNLLGDKVPTRPKLPQLKSSKLLIRLADWKIVAVRYWLHFDGDIEE